MAVNEKQLLDLLRTCDLHLLPGLLEPMLCCGALYYSLIDRIHNARIREFNGDWLSLVAFAMASHAFCHALLERMIWHT
jgi:hypothetical protein